jgi:hypothetical protein
MLWLSELVSKSDYKTGTDNIYSGSIYAITDKNISIKTNTNTRTKVPKSKQYRQCKLTVPSKPKDKTRIFNPQNVPSNHLGVVSMLIIAHYKLKCDCQIPTRCLRKNIL